MANPPQPPPDDLDRYFNDPEYRRRKKRAPEKRKFALPKNIWLYVVAGVGLIGLLAGFISYLLSGLPSLERIENPKPELATKVYSIDGEVLDQFYIKNRSQVQLADINPTVVKALIATEDKDFYRHWGVDAVRFMKAMVKNVITLAFAEGEGASTITMQLSRNLYLGHDDRHVFDTITRKMREFITSIQLERNFTKDEILTFYLNVVYFGRGTYGISSAAQVYFGKRPGELGVPEAAMLVAMLKGPALYDPTNHPERALGRRNLVISQMEKYGFITPQEAQAAKQEPIQLRIEDVNGRAGLAPHFVEYVRQQLMDKAEKYGFDIYRDGIAVYTSLDSRMQAHANRAVEEHLAGYQPLFDTMWDWRRERDALSEVIKQAILGSQDYRRAPTAAARDSVFAALRSNQAWVDSMAAIAQRIEVGFVAIDPKTGGITALVGGSNFREFKYGLNHVTQIRRQAGSAFKPFVFTVAIDNGYAPTFELLNQPVIIPLADGTRWAPQNSDRTVGGKTTLREAVRMSINLVAVRAILEIAPVNQVIEYAKRMGINSPLPPVESLALGTGDVSPLEMASAFGVYANHGVYVEPLSILRIEDKDGNLIEENYPLQREVLSEQTAFIMTTMLEGVVNSGTGGHVRDFFGLPAAGKTGTTTDFADAWFVGYTPQLSAAAWVGFDTKVVHFTTWDGQGGRAAAPIFGRFMKYVYDDPTIGMPAEDFQMPAGIFRDTICVDTKQLATEFCPEKAIEYFTEKTRPPQCTKHTTAKWKDGEEGMGTISF
jgi:penicillin-binding protein 1A